MQVREVWPSPIAGLSYAADDALRIGTRDGRALLLPPSGARATIFDSRIHSPREPVAIHAIRALHGGHALATSVGLIVSSGPDLPSQYSVAASGSTVADLEMFDDNLLAVGFGDRNRDSSGSFALYSHDLQPREPRFPEANGVRSVAVFRAGGLVAWSSGRAKVTIWNPRGQDPIPIPLKHTSPAIGFNEDGTRLSAAQEWGAVILDIAKRHEVGTLAGHTGRVTCLAYSPNGRTIATGSWDGTVRLWDSDGRARTTLSAPLGRIYSLAFSSDGSLLAAAGEKGIVATWDMD